MHADRTNRSLLIVFALLLIGAGGVGAAVSFGAFGSSTEHETLSKNPVWKYVGHHGDWLWLVAAVVALVLIVLALRWLRALLFSTDRAGDLRVHTPRGEGRTTIAPGAVTDAVTTEIQSYPAVAGARARIIGDVDEPQLVVTVTVEDAADLVALRRRIETGALTHARQALDNPTLPIQLDLNVTTKRASRVG